MIDTHVHLHFPDYDSDREEVMDRAGKAGVQIFINVGTDVESSKKSQELAESHDNVFATAGLHPHDAKDATEEAYQALQAMLDHPKVVGIGEVGLDFFRDHSPREKQKEVLSRFFSLYREIRKPLILHCRDAYEDLIAMIRAELPPPVKGIIHCFSSNKETMFKLLDLGFLISFAGPLTYKKNDDLRAACELCPLDRMVFETDAPFLPPQSKRGKRNESAFMLETLQTAAEVRGVEVQDLAEATTRTAARIFGI